MAASGYAQGTDVRGDRYATTRHPGQHSQDAAGYPDRSPDLDALPGFKNPPPGYGEVPFWWWSGEDLDVDRLLWQVQELHKKGISGVQVNLYQRPRVWLEGYHSLGWAPHLRV